MFKKFNIYIFIAVFLSLFVGCAGKLPKNANISMQFQDIKIAQISPDSITFNTHLKITNPYPFEIPNIKPIIKIYNQESLLTSIKLDNMVIKARAKTTIEVPLNINLTNLVDLYKDYKAQSVDLTFVIETKIALPMEQSIDIKDSFNIKVPKFNPQISLKSFNVNMPLNAILVVNMENKNASNFTLKPIKYSIKMDNDEITGVASTKKINDKSVDITFDVKGKLSVIQQFITMKKLSNTPKISIDSAIVFEDLGNYPIPIRFSF